MTLQQMGNKDRVLDWQTEVRQSFLSKLLNLIMGESSAPRENMLCKFYKDF